MANAPFTSAELIVILRALEINRSISELFSQDELERLRAWGVVLGEVEFEPSGQVDLTEDDVHFETLLTLVQERLYQTLFPTPEMKAALRTVLALVPAGKALHICLELPAGDGDQSQNLRLLQYPWEVLCYEGGHLWQDKRIAFSRYIQYPGAVGEPEPVERLNVLVVTSRPRGLPVGPGDDVASMVTALRSRLPRFPVKIRELPRATTEDLGDYLFEYASQPQSPHVLHFDGHGGFGRCCPAGHLNLSASAEACRICGRGLPETFSGYLAFERPDGAVHWVSADELADVLLDHGLKLVVLNACNSGTARRGDDVFNGVAQCLIRRGIPAVVASSFQLDWGAALRFSQYFYQGLAGGDALVEVSDRTRQRLRNLVDTPHEWYRPALYLRQAGDGDGQLFRLQAGVETDVEAEEPEVPVIHIYNFGDLPRALPDEAINWHRYFDRDTSPRTVPQPRIWERVLLPELRERRAEIGERGLIRLRTTGALSVGFAVGHTFKEVGQYRLEVAQSPPAPPEFWLSDQAPPEAGLPEPHWSSQLWPGNPAGNEAVMIVLAVPNRGMSGLVQAVESYLAEPDLQHSQRCKGALLLAGEPAMSENRFLTSWEAAVLSRASRAHLSDFVAQFTPQVVHLFLATPFALAVFLGHQWNAVNTLVQCHEFVGGPGHYAPACRLDLS